MKYLFIIGTLLFVLNETYDNKFLRLFNKLYKYAKFLSFIIPALYYFYDPTVIDDSNKLDLSRLFKFKNRSSKNYNLENKVKRNVSESKKKIVASSQGWKCKNCNTLFDATYEIDHKVPLYKGGTNDIDNLEALCRNCHGKKTLFDKIN
jgi:hypothetical protein